ncbi:MAG TPA: hypothetical protein VFE33_33035 [Thermoanaerobaculia bacterium]|nr:hypothetical protein [Thermoanaerobaculia bacterium]
MISTRPSSRVVGLAAALLLLAVAPLLAATANVISCPFSGAGDSIDRGFYLSYSANNLAGVTLAYTTDVAGPYSITLVARAGSYNGSLVGVPQTVNVNLSPGLMTPVTFNFGGAPVTPGSTLAFTQSATGGNVFFDVGPCNPGSCSACPGVVETVDTAPPLSTVRRGSVGVTATQEVVSGTGCTPSDTVLCIDNNPGDKRFQISVTYATTQSGGLSGNGHAIALAPLGVSQGGIFWFFDRNNPEMLVKVLNACTVNSKFWVFFSAGTNVGFRVTVLDTQTGHERIYVNPDLSAAPPLQDTSALSCP